MSADTTRPVESLAAKQSPDYWSVVSRVFWRRRVNRIAVYGILLILLVALSADFLASDKPILATFHGQLFVLPNLFWYPELQLYDNRLLVQAMQPGDWAVLPLIPWGYNNHDLSSVLAGPSSWHWLGTDPSGRDVAARLIHGARVSLLVAFFSVPILVVTGIIIGSLGGYFGGRFDALSTRAVEILNSLPTLLILVTCLAIFAPRDWGSVVMMALIYGLLGWTTVSRLIRGEILRVKELDFVQASRAQGASDLRVLVQHVIPNALSPVLVASTFAVASVILAEGTLSFLGFGIPADMASWGGVIRQVRGNWAAWWLGVFPGFAIFLTVTLFNIAGEGLRDAIDPRLR
jgi:peptide/nickel transport system permease protein